MSAARTNIRFQRFRSAVRHCAACVFAATALAYFAGGAFAQDRSEPAMLQLFEARWDTIEDRMADIFQVGYGAMWLPPPSRADSGGQSVGYDVLDRFDLGSPRNETLYGTETGLKSSISAAHDASVKMYTDFIPNHNGFSNRNTPNFEAQGGYPGFVLSTPSDQFGDFHDPSISYYDDPVNGSLFGLLDIAHDKNYQYIRHPTQAGNPNNIPAGSIRNQPNASNAQYYADQGLGGTVMTDPALGSTFTRYEFNLDNPLAGDPISENATALLMRNMQWMIQVVGVDGFRVDAARHMPPWVMNYLDNAVFRTSLRTNHDGSIQPIYMFSEVADGNVDNIQQYIRRDLPNKLGISTSDTTVRGNRDALDFSLFWRMVENLSGNGLQNNWHSIRSAAQDLEDDGLMNGSQGVMFVDGHDDHSGQRPQLYKVAHAYTLMLPGNTVVYMNAKEFGEGRDFPKDIGGSWYAMSNDALGGYHGNDVAELVEIRNTHGRGNFQERWIDEAFNPNGFSNIYIYERANSAIIGLNSRADSGYDERTPVQTSFAPNTVLVELTGNAADSAIDPSNQIPEAIRVNGSGQVIMRVPRNSSHGKGYVIYGLATPRGTLSISNVSQVLQGATPTLATNGTARLSDIDVITGNSFTVSLNTTPVTLPAPMGESNVVRDYSADGDHAVIRIDEGMDLNDLSGIDHTSLTSTSYGFENFRTTNSPGFVWSGGTNVGSGFGTYEQSIDTSQLSEGRHYITVRSYRHRDAGTGGDGGPAVFTDFKRTIYVDRLPPESAVVSFAPYASAPSNLNNRDLIVRSVDKTADNMLFLLDLPANMTDEQILLEYNNPSSPYRKAQSAYYDRDQRIAGFNNINFGNHVATVITYEVTGNYNIQRFAGLFTQTTGRGAGFGDMNFGNSYLIADIRATVPNNGSFEDVLYSQNSKFNSAADVNADGLVDNRDLLLLGDSLRAAPTSAFVNATNQQNVLNAYSDLLLKRGDVNSSGTTNSDDMNALYDNFGGMATWNLDLNVDGIIDVQDVGTMITNFLRTVPGDFNLDGLVDTADYVVARKWLGTSNARFTFGDANLDGFIDNTDLNLWRQNYGFARQPLSPIAGGGGGSAQVPEPSALLLIGLLIGLIATSRQARFMHFNYSSGQRFEARR